MSKLQLKFKLDTKLNKINKEIVFYEQRLISTRIADQKYIRTRLNQLNKDFNLIINLSKDLSTLRG